MSIQKNYLLLIIHIFVNLIKFALVRRQLTTVVRSVSKLVAAFISFNKSGVGDTHVMKEYNNFYHPMCNLNYQDSGYYNPDLDLEFQLQLGSKLYPEYPCRS